VAGALPNWRRHLARAQALGFDHLCIPPVFACGSTGDIFLASDVERAAAPLSPSATADDAVASIAALARDHGLALLLDIVLARDEQFRRRRDRIRDLLVEDAELGIHDRRGPLDPGQGDDLRGFETGAGDREVLNRALRLGAVERARGNSHLAHSVVLDAEVLVGAHGVVYSFALGRISVEKGK
jgi:hypothetical protein